jgi:hypothetical protein
VVEPAPPARSSTPKSHDEQEKLYKKAVSPLSQRTIAMSGRIAHTHPKLAVYLYSNSGFSEPGTSHHILHIFAQSYRLNCLRVASKNSANNDEVSNVSKIAKTRPHG